MRSHLFPEHNFFQHVVCCLKICSLYPQRPTFLLSRWHKVDVKVKWPSEYNELNQNHFIFQTHFWNHLEKYFFPLQPVLPRLQATTNQLWVWATPTDERRRLKCSSSQYRACYGSVWMDTHKHIYQKKTGHRVTPHCCSVNLAAFPGFLLHFSLHEPWGYSTAEWEHPLTDCEPALWLSLWLFTLSTNYHMLVHHPLYSLCLAFSPSVLG